MAQLAIAAAFSVGASAAASAAGVAAGATFMGMTAGGWGWMIGSMIGGSLLGGGGGEGPRIEDKRLSTSVYGQPIPWVYGTARVGTQIIWASELIETAKDVGGKGGGDSVTMYEYAAHILVSVCEAPAEPLRIWANGRLIWTADGNLGIVDEEIIQRGNVRVLLGEETQSPDPVYETAVGADLAPAHRGYLTIMFENMQLQFSGNRLPSIEVEVSTNTTVIGCEGEAFEVAEPNGPQVWTGNDATYGDGNNATAFDPETGNLFVLTGTTDGGASGGRKNTLEVWRAGGSGALEYSESISLPTRGVTAGMAIDPDNRLLWVLVGDPAPGANGGPVAAIVNLDTLSVTYSHATMMDYIGASGGCGTDGTGYWCCSPLVYQWYDGTTGNNEGGTGAKGGAMIHIFPGNGGEIAWSRPGLPSPPLQDYGLAFGEATVRSVAGWPLCSIIESLGDARGVYDITSVGAGEIASVLYVPLGDDWAGGINYRIGFGNGGRIEKVVKDSATTVAEGPGGTTSGRLVWAESRRKVFAFYGNDYATIDLSEDGDPGSLATAWTELSKLTEIGGADTLTWSEYHDALLVMRSNVFGIKIGLLDPETDEWVIEPCEYGNYTWPAFLTHGRITGIREVGQGWFVGLTQFSNKLVKFRAPGARVNGGPVILGDIVEDLCVRSGLLAGELDVSTLTDLVDGFKVGRRASARASIDELRSAWPFDAVTSGDVLKFVKRGGVPVLTVDADDLGARVWSGDSQPEPALEIERPARDEVPRELTLTYIDATADYDPGIATARRQIGGSPVVATQELPIVMSADYAGRVAWYNLLAQHAARDAVKFKLPYLYERLEPTDSVWMPDADERLRRVLITNKVNARPLLEFEGVFEDASIYDVLLGTPGREQGPQQTTPQTLSRVVLALLDLPPLRDVDNTLMLYVAAGPADGGAWRGASLYRSQDGGTSFSPALTFMTAATLGVATTALADWTGGNVFDESNTVTVRLDNGTLQSVTELALLNGANAAALGDEIFQFQTAELVGEREWRLSRLLRGRRGTERGQSTHAIGERFVLLAPATLQLLPYDYIEVGVPRHYKLAAPGAQLSSVTSVAHTAQGNSVKPLAPVWIAGERDGGDLAITWTRRARINAEWRDVIDVPLDEPSEEYQIDILDGLTVVRTLTASSPTVTYTAAQQTSDFGSPQSSVSVAVYQISSRLGRGHAGTATV